MKCCWCIDEDGLVTTYDMVHKKIKDVSEGDIILGINSKGKLSKNKVLKKFDNGTYGLCEACGEQGKPEAKARIPKARLQAIPHARNCVECERIKEKGR